jgi:hypothetical protein
VSSVAVQRIEPSFITPQPKLGTPHVTAVESEEKEGESATVSVRENGKQAGVYKDTQSVSNLQYRDDRLADQNR